MLRGLLLLFIVVPLLELYLLTLVAQAAGFWSAVALTVGTGLVGGALAKREGIRVWQSWQSALARLEVPEEGVVAGLLVLVGGVLLVTPGVLTDVTGFLLLLPPTRRFLANKIRERVTVKYQASASAFQVYRKHESTVETSGTSLD